LYHKDIGMYIGELEHGETGPTVFRSVKMASRTADTRSRRSAQMIALER
jgi:hypothetical protein